MVKAAKDPPPSLEEQRRRNGGARFGRIVLDPEAELHPAPYISPRICACAPPFALPTISPTSSFSLCFPSLSLSICFTIALAGSVIPIPDLYNTISTDRVSHCLAQDAFHSTPSDLFPSRFVSLFFSFSTIIFRICRTLLF